MTMNDIGGILTGGLIILIMVTGLVCLGVIFKKIGAGIKEVPNMPVTGFETDCDDRN